MRVSWPGMGQDDILEGIELLGRKVLPDQPELLRASYIKPWADCATDGERLDVFNGLLLAAHLDAAFDATLLTFEDDGSLILSARLTERSRAALSLKDGIRLGGLTPRHAPYLSWHRRLV